ncbi:predicted protein [Chaetoceros tenuissimus]|uniref:Uncharacterized protein n=1 Tax=Chaetoceros tenuissimus TaxID=426638 RepID=A0AAD3DBN6_9STRA|nr:predicted protein [Chaetoceros tenuissimus]
MTTQKGLLAKNNAEENNMHLVSGVSNLDTSNPDAFAVVMMQMKAKEMYLRARLAELDRQEDLQTLQRQVWTASPVADDYLLSTSQQQNNRRNKQKGEEEDVSVVSIESSNTPSATPNISSVTRQGENHSRRPSCNILKSQADLILRLLADE